LVGQIHLIQNISIRKNTYKLEFIQLKGQCHQMFFLPLGPDVGGAAAFHDAP
jgi:hypothetical protein